jgi:hypothetical protein
MQTYRAVMSDAWDQNPFKDEPILRFFRELSKVKESHRSLVLVTNGFLELLVESLVKAKCKNAGRITGDNRSYPYSSKLLILNEIGALPDAQYRLFDWFRKLRNDAAHNPFFEISESTLQQLSNEEFKRPEKFYDFCVILIGGFWSDHLDIFGPVFAPMITGKDANASASK